MKLKTTVTVDFDNRYAKQVARDFCESVVLDMLIEATELARLNVSPGMGPGPHPHMSEHFDTGRLAAAIENDIEVDEDGVMGVVGVAQEPMATYGAALELGWHARNGAFYRYPWLAPAVLGTGGALRVRAARKVKSYFRGRRVGRRRGRGR